MNCCVCIGTCSHVGNHSYCAAHSYMGGELPPASYIYSNATTACATCDAKSAHIESLKDEVAELRARLESWEFFVRNRLYKVPVEFSAPEEAEADA